MPNRLADETSPYLKQHKDNPVDWYPWGDEAFAEARRRDVPVLLSVGYSACHWCHVMAHESFEDPDVAAVMNELFVNVKVDREERPDVDAIYMDATQAMTGAGGWPMTVFLTPDGRPFYAGTYFPPRTAHGRPGFVDLLHAVAGAWRSRRSDVEQQADQLSEAVRARSTLDTDLPFDAGAAPDVDAAALLGATYERLRAAFDPHFGGFGGAPKFPQVTFLELVARAYARNRSPDTLAMLTTTLDAMASGGIYDHLGGGFARYSVDARWLVPHFEKMLYDQAQLLRAYVHGWQLTGRPEWRQVAEETVAYVLRDLRPAEGVGVWSAEDADSEGVEGRFYVWSLDEVRRVAGDVADAALEWYGVTEAGNFEGANILWRPRRGELLRPPDVEEARRRLFEARSSRVRPGLDDKVLTEWNAMFVSALAEAGAALGRPDWLDTAAGIAEFLLASLRRPSDGRWLRSWQGGRANPSLLAYAADHAWLVDAFTRLAEARGEARWIAEARAVADALLSLFEDREGGGFFTSGDDAERLLVRQKDHYDGATPSANGVAAVALARLSALCGEERYATAAERTLSWLAPAMAGSPQAFTTSLAAADLLSPAAGMTEIVVPGDDRADLVRAVHESFLPSAVLAWGEAYPSPLWEGRSPGAAYVCRDYTCGLPASSVEDLRSQLGLAPR
jgi:uncharacterized protein YyaL (SSP411 family)